MKYRVSRLTVAALLIMLAIALSAAAAHSAVVIYLDEYGAGYGYQSPDAYDATSALTALASPPTAELAGKELHSGVLPGTRVLSIQTAGDTTTVDFSKEIIGTGLDELRLSLIFDQVKSTLLQFGFKGNIAITVAGKPLPSFVKAVPAVAPSAEALREQALRAGRPIVGTGLGGHKITVSPGHGWMWNGSGWYTQRPVYCSPLNQEDFHNLEDCQFLETYLSQDGATVKMVRCTDKNYGNSPYSGSHPWWQMGATYWLANIGYPCSVYGPDGCNLGTGGSDSSNDILSRPLSSDYDASDIYLSMHTNGYTGDCYDSVSGYCPSGTATYYDAGPDHSAYGTVSQNLATAIQNAIMDAVRTKYSDSGWTNRGVLNSNGAYGEIRVPQRAAILTELAFHDSCETDAVKLRDNFFKSTAMWAVYKGVCDYFGATPTWDYYSCEVVSNDIPSAMSIGETRTVHVVLRNRGVLWNDAKAFHLGAVGDSDPFSTTTRQAIAGEVGPNSTYTFTFNLKAPNSVGTFTTDWRMVRDGYTWFGPTVSQDIVVTGVPDYDPPTAPTNLSGVSPYSYRINLTWDASTDNIGVAGYNIYRDSVKIGSSATTSYTDNTCSPSTTYTYEVSAYDGVPNESGKSTPAVVSSQPPDSSPPTKPGNLHSTAVTSSSVALAWTASTDNYGVVGYNIYRNNVKIGSSATTSYTDSTCSPSTAYTYEVTAYDAIPNESVRSDPAVVTTQSAYTQIWAEGFNGDLANWAQGATAFTYSTAKTHATYTGIGAAYGAAAASNQMYRSLGSRPFAEGHASGYFFDGKDGYKTGVCGWAYRQSLSLRDGTGGAMFLDNEFYSSTDNTKYFYRSYGGSGTHTAYGTRWAATNCTGAWIYFESTVTPNAPGASPIGTWVPKCTDGGGTVTGAAVNLPSNFFTAGMGRITLGLGVSSTNECYWDDIRFEATAPGAPVIGAATANSSSQITWTWSRADNNLFGFNVADGSGTIKAPQYPNTGWKDRSATSWAEAGLTANTQYTRKVAAWNGSLDSQYSGTVSKYTLSVPPTTSTVTCDKPANTWSGSPDFTFTAVGGFGASKIQYYRIAWDQSPTHTWTGTEFMWSEGTISHSCVDTGGWYLHVKGYNGDNAANGTLDLGPYKYDATPPTTPVVTDEGTYTPSTGDLSATWTCSALSGMAGYQYAIRTTSGGDNDVVEWTDVGSASVNRTGLTLTAGTTYYFAVKGQSNTGLWSDVGVSDGIKVVADTDTIPDAKALDNTGHEVALLNKAVTADFGACSYIQEPSGGESEYSAVKLDKGGFAKGSFVNVAGVIGLVDGERVIQTCTIKSGTTGTMPKPIMMINRYIGGYALNDYTPGVSGSQGLNNLGLLVTTMGKLSKPASGNWWYVDDGSGVQYDETYMGTPIDPSLLSTSKKAELVDGASVVVIGICQVGTVNSAPAPILKLRGDGDIVHYP